MEPFRQAYTVDSLGLPALTNVSHDPVAEKARLIFREVMSRNVPGQSTQDRYAQASLGYNNHAYLAINTLLRWLRRAEFSIQRKQPSKLGKSFAGASSNNSEWVPVEDNHPAAKLFESPNSQQTRKDYLTERALCRCIFGVSFEYVVKNGFGAPCELYVLRPQYVQAMPMSAEFPCGYYQVATPTPMYGWSVSSFRVDSRDVIRHHYDHPMFPWDAYSPNTAGAQMLDLLNATITGMKNAMDNGLSMKALLKLQGAGDDEVARFTEGLKTKFTGASGSQFMVTNASEIDAEMLSTTPDKMAFGPLYADAAKFVSALYGVSERLSGLGESGSFSELFAAFKAFSVGTLGDELDSTAGCWTKNVIQETWPDCKAVFVVPTIEDDSQKLAQMQHLDGLQGVGMTLNEARAANNMKPIDGGDVTPLEYKAMVAARVAEMYPPPAPAMPPGQDPNAMGGDDQQQAPADPNDPAGQQAPADEQGQPVVSDPNTEDAGDDEGNQHAMMQSVMKSFGVDASQGQPDANPQQTQAMTKGLVRWLKSFDESKVKRDGGKFSHEKGADKKEKPEPDMRPNADLDEAFGKAPDAKPKPADDIRKNDLLDDAFDPKPKPAPAPAPPITDAEYAEYRGLQNASDSGRPLKPSAKHRLAHLDAKLKETAANGGEKAPDASPAQGKPAGKPGGKPMLTRHSAAKGGVDTNGVRHQFDDTPGSNSSGKKVTDFDLSPDHYSPEQIAAHKVAQKQAVAADAAETANLPADKPVGKPVGKPGGRPVLTRHSADKGGVDTNGVRHMFDDTPGSNTSGKKVTDFDLSPDHYTPEQIAAHKVAQAKDAADNPAPPPDQQGATPDAVAAGQAAKAAAKNLDPETLPIAKRFIVKLKAMPPVAAPVGRPEDWLPNLLKEYLPIFIKAMQMKHGAAMKLLLFGAMAALHHASKPKPPAKLPVAKPLPLRTAKRAPAVPATQSGPPSDPTPRPKNEAGKGSLPGRMGKSIVVADWATYFAGLSPAS